MAATACSANARRSFMDSSLKKTGDDHRRCCAADLPGAAVTTCCAFKASMPASTGDTRPESPARARRRSTSCGTTL
eukprot:2840532-Prymnesium_polylepis.2